MKAPSLVQRSSTLADGNMSFVHGAVTEVVNSRDHFLQQLGLGLNDCVAASLEHQTRIELVTIQQRGTGMSQPNSGVVCDALVTQELGLGLFVLTADCLPITFFDPVQQVISLAHVSRANTQMNFSAKILTFLVDQFGSSPRNLEVTIGPAIHKESYLMDLVGENVSQLVAGGVTIQQISINPVDTFTSSNYFSHRRSAVTGEPEGRFATVAVMT